MKFAQYCASGVEGHVGVPVDLDRSVMRPKRD